MRSRRRDGCYTCGSALKYSFPVIVARSGVHVQAYIVGVEREVLLSLTERKRIKDYHAHLPATLPRSPQTSPKPPLRPPIGGQRRREEGAKGPPCFSSPALLFFHPRGARNGAEISAGCVN